MSTSLCQNDCKAAIPGWKWKFLGRISSLWLLKGVAWCSVSILVPQSTGIISEVGHLEAVNNISNVVLTCLWDASRPRINRLDMWKIRAQKRVLCELWARRFDIISSGHQHIGYTISDSHSGGGIQHSCIQQTMGEEFLKEVCTKHEITFTLFLVCVELALVGWIAYSCLRGSDRFSSFTLLNRVAFKHWCVVVC